MMPTKFAQAELVWTDQANMAHAALEEFEGPDSLDRAQVRFHVLLSQVPADATGHLATLRRQDVWPRNDRDVKIKPRYDKWIDVDQVDRWRGHDGGTWTGEVART